MGKRELKKQYKNYDFSVIDMVTKFDPTDNNKLTPFLMKMVEDKMSRPRKTRLRRGNSGGSYIDNIVKPTNVWETRMAEIVQDLLGGSDNTELIEKFAKHQSAGRIKESDINRYNTWSEISKVVATAEVKVLDKELAKQIEIIYQDDTWLFLKPLSLRASQTYGMATKWCTSMKHEPSYFYRYSRDGILVYTINKKTGRKFGFYSSPKEFSVWDVQDKRVDSLETRIPVDLLAIVRESLDLDNNPTNEKKFSPEEWNERSKWFGDEKVSMDHEDMEMPMGEEMMGEADMTITMEAPAPEPQFFNGGNITTQEERMVEYVDDASEELVEANNEDWEPRGADVAFGELGIAPNAGMAIEAEMPQEMVNEEVMYVTEDQVADAPAYTGIAGLMEIVTEDYGEMEVEARGVGYDIDEPDVAGVMDL
jgi:hypothetical protein